MSKQPSNRKMRKRYAAMNPEEQGWEVFSWLDHQLAHFRDKWGMDQDALIMGVFSYGVQAMVHRYGAERAAREIEDTARSVAAGDHDPEGGGGETKPES